MISVIGVANFEYRNAPAAHMTFAGFLFVLADVYLVMMTRIGNCLKQTKQNKQKTQLNNNNKQPDFGISNEPRSILIARGICATVAMLLVFPLVLPLVFDHENSPWKTTISTTSEIETVACLFIWFGTHLSEFKRISFRIVSHDPILIGKNTQDDKAHLLQH